MTNTVTQNIFTKKSNIFIFNLNNKKNTKKWVFMFDSITHGGRKAWRKPKATTQTGADRVRVREYGPRNEKKNNRKT